MHKMIRVKQNVLLATRATTTVYLSAAPGGPQQQQQQQRRPFATNKGQIPNHKDNAGLHRVSVSRGHGLLQDDPNRNLLARYAGPEKLKHRITRARIATNLECKELLLDGKISVNGKTATSLGAMVSPKDKVKVVGHGVISCKPLELKIWIAYKMLGEIVTRRDPQGRKSLLERLEGMGVGDGKKLIAVGRLDMNSEGLMVLTNNPALARWMELPSTGMKRVYRAQVWSKKPIADGLLNWLGADGMGLRIGQTNYGPIEAKVVAPDRDDRGQNKRDQRGAGTGLHSWVRVSLREGKKREVREVFKGVGMRVKRLVRHRYGPFDVAGLKPGEVLELNRPGLLRNLDNQYPEWRQVALGEEPRDWTRKPRENPVASSHEGETSLPDAPVDAAAAPADTSVEGPPPAIDTAR
jgi:23S rRNA pseudouridine2605 synthase